MKFHQCAATGCTTQIPESQFMCAHCWRRVPPRPQTRLRLAKSRYRHDNLRSQTELINAQRSAIHFADVARQANKLKKN